jgi:hypothetical protein
VPPKPTVESRAASGFVGQSVVGYRQDDTTGEWLPIKKFVSGPGAIGPGTYDPQYSADPDITPVCLDMSANRDLYGSPVENPGPGAYTPMTPDLRIPRVIGNRIEAVPSTSIRKIYSGPRVWTSLATETHPVFRFHGERKLFPEVEETPDPGQYDIAPPPTQVPGDRSGFGARGTRQPLYSMDDNPGPGTYDITGRWIGRRTSTVRRAVDHDDPSTIAPGPGAYDPHPAADGDGVHPHSVFLSGAARTQKVTTLPPGPGRYSPKFILKSPARIHQGRFERHGNWIEQSKIEGPSPDAYQEIMCNRGEGKTIPKSPRFERMSVNGVPGPGTYAVKHQSFLKRSRNSSVPPFDFG